MIFRPSNIILSFFPTSFFPTSVLSASASLKYADGDRWSYHGCYCQWAPSAYLRASDIINGYHLHIWESWNTYKWVMEHEWMSHETRINESWNIYEWVMTRTPARQWKISKAKFAKISMLLNLLHKADFWDVLSAKRPRFIVINHEYYKREVIECNTYEWASHVTRMNATCHTCEGVMACKYAKRPKDYERSCYTHEWVMVHTWMSHVTHMNESCYTREWASHVTHEQETCHTYEWDLSRIWMSRVTQINGSFHTHAWVMSHIWRCHVTPMNETCHTYE